MANQGRTCMRKLKEIWLGLDIINRIILISGILACIWFVVKGHGLYGAALVVLMGMLMVSRKNNREKRLSRLYGYASCKGDEDTGNSFYQDMRGKAMSTLVTISSAAALAPS